MNSQLCRGPEFCTHYPIVRREGAPPGVRHTHAGLIDPQLYGNQLQNFCRMNEIQLNLSRERVKSNDACHMYGIQHWHPNDPHDQRLSNEHNRMKDKIRKEQSLCQLSTNRTRDVVQNFFMDRREFDHPKPQLYEPDDHERSFCQFCTGAGKKKDIRKKRVHGKPRIKYIVDLPYVRPKTPPPKPEAEEILFKVEIRTGDQPDAGSSTPIFITLFGKEGETRRRQLKKMQGSLASAFHRSTKNIFHLRTPNIGDLRAVTLEHESGRPEDSWFVEEITITNIFKKQVYFAPCRKWLSMWKDDYMVKRKFKVEKLKTPQKHFKVTTVTGNHPLGGITDSKVYITFVGQKRKTGKIRLENDSSKCFTPSHEDTFQISVDDFGALQSVRIEHDGGYATVKGTLDENQKDGDRGYNNSLTREEKDVKAANEWFLERLLVKDLENGKTYDFPINEWLGVSTESGKCYKELDVKRHAVDTKRKKKVEDIEDVMYDIVFHTGKRSMSGTDATVSLQLYGASRKTAVLEFEDKGKDKFESGTTDEFRVKAADVGRLEKVRVWHSDMGVAAGWFLDKIVIKRYYNKDEIYEKLCDMKKAGRLPIGLTIKDGNVILGHKDDDEESDTEEEEKSSSSEESSSDGDEALFSKLRRRRSTVSPAKRRSTVLRDLEEEERARGKRQEKQKSSRRPKSAERRPRGRARRSPDSDDEEERPGRRAMSDSRGRASRPPLPSVSLKESFKGKRRTRYETSSSESSSDEESSRDDRARSHGRVAVMTVALPCGDEFVFKCGSWLAKDESDGKIERTLKLSDSRALHTKVRVRPKKQKFGAAPIRRQNLR